MKSNIIRGLFLGSMIGLGVAFGLMLTEDQAKSCVSWIITVDESGTMTDMRIIYSASKRI